jgi:hypothetical protein
MGSQQRIFKKPAARHFVVRSAAAAVRLVGRAADTSQRIKEGRL